MSIAISVLTEKLHDLEERLRSCVEGHPQHRLYSDYAEDIRRALVVLLAVAAASDDEMERRGGEWMKYILAMAEIGRNYCAHLEQMERIGNQRKSFE